MSRKAVILTALVSATILTRGLLSANEKRKVLSLVSSEWAIYAPQLSEYPVFTSTLISDQLFSVILSELVMTVYGMLKGSLSRFAFNPALF